MESGCDTLRPTGSLLTRGKRTGGCELARRGEALRARGGWIEQSYKHVKHVLGWSQYQVRSDQAIRRDFQLVCCAFSFCWYHASHSCSSTTEDAREASEPPPSQEPEVAVDVTATGKKISKETGSRPPLCWPVALRAVRGWLEPWIMLRRFWRAWSEQPPPPLLQRLLDQLGRGHALFLYGTF